MTKNEAINLSFNMVDELLKRAKETHDSREQLILLSRAEGVMAMRQITMKIDSLDEGAKKQ